VVGIALAVLPTKMRILPLSKDRPFCDRLRLAFAREGCALRVSDRQGIWSRSTIDDDVMLLHSGERSGGGALVPGGPAGPPVRGAGRLLRHPGSPGRGGHSGRRADDAIATTAPESELLARVRAVCRRSRTLNVGQRRWGPS